MSQSEGWPEPGGRTGPARGQDRGPLITLLRRGFPPAADRPAPGGDRPEAPKASSPTLLSLVPGAAIGLGVEAERSVAAAVSALRGRVVPAVDAVARQTPLRLLEALRRTLVALDDRGRAEESRARAAAEEFARGAIPEMTRVVVDRIDLNAIVATIDLERILDRIDLDDAIARLDIDRILARIDVEGLVNRVDVGRIIARLDVDGIIARVDVDRILARVDVDGIVDRMDVDGIVERVDLTRIAREVIDELDLAELVRESTATVTTDAVDMLRAHGLNADALVARLVDRVLRRRAERDLSPPGEPEPEPDKSPSETTRDADAAGA